MSSGNHDSPFALRLATPLICARNNTAALQDNLRWMFGCRDFGRRRHNCKQKVGITFSQQKRCSLDTCVSGSGGERADVLTSRKQARRIRLHAVWLSAGMITRFFAKMCIFFMTIICCACVCPAAQGIKIKCCDT